MKSIEDKHWTDDPERVERYVSNQLNADERNELEDHLRVCEVCKRAVRSEQILIAGIRRSGRDAFKAEVQRKIALMPEERTPWLQILSAAAVIVILLTVALYNRWFETQQPESSEPIVLTQPQLPAEEEDKKPDRAIAQQERVQPQTTTSVPPRDKESIQYDAHKAEAAEPLPTTPAPKAERARVEGAAGSQMQSSEIASDAATQVSGAMSGSEALSNNTTEPLNVWIEGTILPYPESAAQDIVTKNSRPSAQTYTQKKSAEARIDKFKPGQNLIAQNIVLNQQVLSPVQQQKRTQQNASSTIPAQIIWGHDRLELTLFLDSLLSDQEFAKATVETRANDTVIVNLQNRRVAYEIPRGWNTSQTKPTK